MTARHIVLVGCCAEKLERIAPARDLYRSQLFRAAATWAQANGDEWRVISARYGLIKPDSSLAPYEHNLKDDTPEQRAAWARNMATEIDILVDFLEVPCRFTLLAGQAYATWVQPHHDVAQPLAGLQIGQRLQWFKAQREMFEEAAL